MLPELLATRYTSGAETLFAGIYKLLPGHRLVFEDGAVRIEQYWDLPLDGPTPSSTRSATRELIDRFRRAPPGIGAAAADGGRAARDVPSGGIDSSAIAALMAREIDRPIETFSVAFADRAFSELEYARAGRAGDRRADATRSSSTTHDFFAALPRLIWHEDEPIAHPSSVPLHFVSTLARQHVKVVLTGEGSDELLAGYGKYPRAL